MSSNTNFGNSCIGGGSRIVPDKPQNETEKFNSPQEQGNNRYANNAPNSLNTRYDNNGGGQNNYNRRYDNGGQNNRYNGGQNNRYNGGSSYNKTFKDPERMSRMQEHCNKKYDYTSMAEDLLEKDDIVTSSEVFKMEGETFDDMGGDEGLKETLLQGMYAYGFENPARIQSLAIPQIISGREVLAQSQSGTGKTGAFVISALQLIDDNLKAPQAIILSPTCELAQQTYVVACSIGTYMKNVNFSLTAGGVDRFNNIRQLGGIIGNKKTEETSIAQLIVATPGRLKDLLAYSPELFDNIKLLIVDECDELLRGTFKDELKTIIKALPTDIKISLFSATLNTDVIKLTDALLDNPVKILIKKEKITLKGIKQTFVKINNQDEKIEFLKDMLKTLPIQQFLVYVNSKKNAERLKEQLEKDNYAVMTINGTNTKLERAEIIRNFKKGGAKCLISTDLLSRGIDIQQLSLVINYDLPRADNIQSYIHRIGRTGRYGRKGLSINLCTDYDKDIQNLIAVTFKCQILPLKMDFISDI
jgi:superfamily II DNA/RNA helicase